MRVRCGGGGGSGRSGVVGNNDTERIGMGGADRSGYEKYIKYVCVSLGGAACLSAVVVVVLLLVVGPPTGTGHTTHRYLDAKCGSVPDSTICRSLGCGRVVMCTATIELVGRRRHRLVKLSTHIAIYYYFCMIDRLLLFSLFFCFFSLSLFFPLFD